MAGEAQSGGFSCWHGSLFCRVPGWHCSPSGTIEQPGIKAGLSRAASAQQGAGHPERVLTQKPRALGSLSSFQNQTLFTQTHDSWL